MYGITWIAAFQRGVYLINLYLHCLYDSLGAVNMLSLKNSCQESSPLTMLLSWQSSACIHIVTMIRSLHVYCLLRKINWEGFSPYLEDDIILKSKTLHAKQRCAYIGCLCKSRFVERDIYLQYFRRISNECTLFVYHKLRHVCKIHLYLMTEI